MDVAPVLFESEPRAVRLMNTIWADRAGVHDSLASAELFGAWAESVGLARDQKWGERELARARELRDAVRRLAAAVTGDIRPAALTSSMSIATALATFNGFLAEGRLTLTRISEGEFERTWATPGSRFDRELFDMAREASGILGAGDRGLGACGGPGCVLYFTRGNARRAYCSAGCGNRARVARHYRRHKTEQ